MEVPDDFQDVKEQDTSGAFQYSLSGWETNPENLSSYDGNTGQ